MRSQVDQDPKTIVGPRNRQLVKHTTPSQTDPSSKSPQLPQATSQSQSGNPRRYLSQYAQDQPVAHNLKSSTRQDSSAITSEPYGDQSSSKHSRQISQEPSPHQSPLSHSSRIRAKANEFYSNQSFRASMDQTQKFVTNGQPTFQSLFERTQPPVVTKVAFNQAFN